ncbi:MAG TPA: NUDIX hydrolase [Candidatus Nitrosotalea sp.]|nr:NUDIX hydrolase [Nitrososphaerota archaeon]HKU32373.1 NUDIX hydrolase [Candidatus Nitrosotalea sp.]
MRKKIFQGRVLSLSVYKVSLRGRKVTREVIEHPGAAAVLAIDKGKLLLVKQHRFPHGFVLEIPAGTLNKGESPKKCAFRELKEETGHEAKKMSPLVKYYPSIGYNTEIIHCFVASGIREISGLELDEDEIISVVKMDFKKVLRMVLSGKIKDSKTICAVLTYAMKKKIYL